MATLFLIIQLGMTFQTYKADIPGMDKLPKTGDDEEINKKLGDALICCKYVPHCMIIYFFWYLLAEYAGFELQSWAQNCMYLSVWGVFFQAIGVFGGKLGKFLRMLGLLLMFIGLVALLYTAMILHLIGLGPYTTPLTATALGLVGGVIVFQGLVVCGTECSDAAVSKDKIAIMQKIIKVLDYATVLAVLMLYVHFRALMIGATLPPAVFYSCYGVATALGLMCLFMALDMTGPGALLVAILYIGFGTMVTAALIMRPGNFEMPEDLYPDFTNPEPLAFSLVTILLTLTYIGCVVQRMGAEVEVAEAEVAEAEASEVVVADVESPKEEEPAKEE